MQEEERERKMKFVIFDRFSFTVVILNCRICQNTGYDTGIVGCSVKSSGMLERRVEDCFVTFRFDCIYLCANWIMVEILFIYLIYFFCLLIAVGKKEGRNSDGALISIRSFRLSSTVCASELEWKAINSL